MPVYTISHATMDNGANLKHLLESLVVKMENNKKADSYTRLEDSWTLMYLLTKAKQRGTVDDKALEKSLKADHLNHFYNEIKNGSDFKNGSALSHDNDKGLRDVLQDLHQFYHKTDGANFDHMVDDRYDNYNYYYSRYWKMEGEDQANCVDNNSFPVMDNFEKAYIRN